LNLCLHGADVHASPKFDLFHCSICPVHSFIFFRRSTIQVFLFDSFTFCIQVFFGSNSRVIKLNLLIKYKIETQRIKVEKIL
jgi:hypothetical protein